MYDIYLYVSNKKHICYCIHVLAGADPGFQVKEGGANFGGVFRVKNHDFTPKNHIFSNFRGGCAPP